MLSTLLIAIIALGFAAIVAVAGWLHRRAGKLSADIRDGVDV